MRYELAWTPEADEAMAALEADDARVDVVTAVHRALGRLELDPFDPRLGTRTFVTEGFEHVRATPVRQGDWWVLWIPGPEHGTRLVVHVGEIRL